MAQWSSMRRVCRNITQAVPHLILTPYRVYLHGMRLSQEDCGGGMGRHGHSFYELLLFLAGTGVLLSDGHAFQAGTILYHSPEVLHAWQPTSRVIKLALWFEVSPRVSLPVPTSWPCWPDAVLEMFRLLGDAEQQRPGWQDRAACHLGLVLSSVLSLGEVSPGDGPPHNTMATDLVTLVDQYLRDNLAQRVRLSDVASHVSLSERTLTTHFRQATGETVMSRLLRLRLERVNELLLTTDATLTEIGCRVGITDPSYLCRCYRRQYPTSPRQFQRLSHIE